MSAEVVVGDCVEVMARMEACSVDAVVCDPPYGLEFMGKEWDRLDGWQAGGGFSSPGIGERDTDWPSFSSTSRFGAANPTCAVCGGRLRGARKCSCEQPHDHWKPIGKRRDPENEGLPDDMTGGGYARQARAMQAWHHRWAVEALRVLRPGGYLLAFGGTRTSHRLVCALEDAGFEIRDRVLVLADGELLEVDHPVELDWIYGTGFPKSLDVAKAIDSSLGAVGERGEYKTAGHAAERDRPSTWDRPWHDDPDAVDRNKREYLPATEEARAWRGWGTALKPAHEPIVVARKPMAGTVAANVLAHGTGAINVGGCLIGFAGDADEAESKRKNEHDRFGSGPRGNEVYGRDERDRTSYAAPGRWPANVVLIHSEGCRRVGAMRVDGDGHFPASRPASTTLGGPEGHAGQAGLEERHVAGELVEAWECAAGCPVAAIDAQTGDLGVSAGGRINKAPGANDNTYGGGWQEAIPGDPGYGDRGGPSRFFYCAKASRAERNAGLGGFVEQTVSYMNTHGGNADKGETWHPVDERTGVERDRFASSTRNMHPTVKPVELMRWLVRLVCRPGGLVLDPFCGSGTTGIACALEGIAFVGVEKYPREGEPDDPDFAGIARARIRFWSEHGEAALEEVRRAEQGEARRAAVAESGQLELG